MTRSRLVAILLLALILLPTQSQSQIDLSFVTAPAGAIRTESFDNGMSGGYLWSFYPEIEVGGHFLARYLLWSASWGYWSDGIDKPYPYMDYVTYSRQGHILALRIGLQLQTLAPHFPLPLTVSLGSAYHVSKQTYIGGSDFNGKTGTNSTEQTTTGLVGLGFSFPLFSRIDLSAQAFQFIPFGNDPIDHAQTNRRAFTLGLALSL